MNIEELREHLTTINRIRGLGDAVYDVRERADLSALADGQSSWEHPDVLAYSKAVEAIQEWLGPTPKPAPWRELTTADDARAAFAAGEEVEFTSLKEADIDDTDGRGGWVECICLNLEYILTLGRIRARAKP